MQQMMYAFLAQLRQIWAAVELLDIVLADLRAQEVLEVAV
jgi:hypothetical protein